MVAGWVARQPRRHHRPRCPSTIEERFKDSKLGQARRHLPSGKLAANRLWLCCLLLALNITAWVCDISPAAGASGSAPQDTPLRRHAKTLRHLLFCVPARIVRTARRTMGEDRRGGETDARTG